MSTAIKQTVILSGVRSTPSRRTHSLRPGVTGNAASIPPSRPAGRLFCCLKGTPMQTLAYLLARFSEPSSYAGIGALLALVGWNLSDPLLGQLAQLLAGGCALAALALKERGVIPVIALVFAVAPALAGCGG